MIHGLWCSASEAERAEWHAKARSAGLTLSDLVRRSVGRVRTWTAPAAEVERERTRQVARLGNNLNQIARWASTHGSEAEAVEVVAEGLSPPFNSWPAAADDAAGQPGGHRRRDSGDGAPRSLPRQRRGKLGVQRGAQRPLGQTAMFNIAWAGSHYVRRTKRRLRTPSKAPSRAPLEAAAGVSQRSPARYAAQSFMSRRRRSNRSVRR